MERNAASRPHEVFHSRAGAQKAHVPQMGALRGSSDVFFQQAGSNPDEMES